MSKQKCSSSSLFNKLEMKRIENEVKRKQERERMKSMETPEKKRARRLCEKTHKEQKRRERMGWDREYQHYTNDDNPFGDSHLTATFVWGKKLEKHGLKHATSAQLEAISRQKQLENRQELEKVKKSRQKRELERQQREEEANLMQRSREAVQYDEWERQEDQFHLEQAKLRSKIRIQDGRAKPIDLLAHYISEQGGGLEESIEMQMNEPYTYLNGLASADLEDLLADIKVYQELEKTKANDDYWRDLTIIVADELRKQQRQDEEQRRDGIHQSVARDVGEIFKGKTTTQLDELRLKIEGKIENQSDSIDVGYWESLLSQLKAHMARSRLRESHQQSLRLKLDLLRSEQVLLKQEKTEQQEHAQEQDDNEPGTLTMASSSSISAAALEADDTSFGEDDILAEAINLYALGSYSPKYTRPEMIETGLVAVTETEDEARLEALRSRVLGRVNEEEEGDKLMNAHEMRLRKEAQKGMDSDEVQFSVETAVDQQVYLWSDKYRPRKPRYFNRVHTGFEWNKYNQTHYDMDNPPPKIVQGYKFNIFYPDLIDKGKTPQYHLSSCPDNKDFATLRFSAGPPYEDIAFKIVNREWEYSYKRGFRCQFHNNIFQLWFHFKRYRYRR